MLITRVPTLIMRMFKLNKKKNVNGMPSQARSNKNIKSSRVSQQINNKRSNMTQSSRIPIQHTINNTNQ